MGELPVVHHKPVNGSVNGRLSTGASQIPQELQGIHPVGIVVEARLLGLSELGIPMAHHALDIRVVRQRALRPVCGIIFVIQYADGAERGAIFRQQDRLIAHIVLFIQDEQGQLVIVVMLVPGKIGEVIIPPEGLQEG